MNLLFLTIFLRVATAEELTFQTGQALAVHLPTGGLDQIGVALQKCIAIVDYCRGRVQ